jgi:hypothetical protein
MQTFCVDAPGPPLGADSTLGFDYQNVNARDGKRPRRV